jgi:hypothetical protein
VISLGDSNITVSRSKGGRMFRVNVRKEAGRGLDILKIKMK